jgi:hypothetical protein
MKMDGQTDMTKFTGTFLQVFIANALKIKQGIIVFYRNFIL